MRDVSRRKVVGDVEEGTAEQVADVAGIIVRLQAFFGGHDHFQPGQGLGGFDGSDTFKLQDDSSEISTDGEEEVCDVRSTGLRCVSGEARGGKEDSWIGLESFGKVGEELSENLALAALRPNDLSKQEPGRPGGCFFLSHGRSLSPLEYEAETTRIRYRMAQRLLSNVD